MSNLLEKWHQTFRPITELDYIDWLCGYLDIVDDKEFTHLWLYNTDLVRWYLVSRDVVIDIFSGYTAYKVDDNTFICNKGRGLIIPGGIHISVNYQVDKNTVTATTDDMILYTEEYKSLHGIVPFYLPVCLKHLDKLGGAFRLMNILLKVSLRGILDLIQHLKVDELVPLLTHEDVQVRYLAKLQHNALTGTGNFMVIDF